MHYQQKSERNEHGRSGGDEITNEEHTADDATNRMANNSIINKVKSRVSSILPSTLTNWFSPNKNNSDNSESVNGNLRTSPNRRRRRRIDDDEEEAEIEAQPPPTPQRRLEQRNEHTDGEEEEDNNTERDNDNSDAEDETVRARRDAAEPPHAKRSRMDITNFYDSTLMQYPLSASTPAVRNPTTRSGFQQASTSSAALMTPIAGYPPNKRYMHLNLYGPGKKEPAYNFVPQYEQNNSPDIIDLVPVQAATAGTPNRTLDNTNLRYNYESSQRGMNVPWNSQSMGTYTPLPNLKRQSLHNMPSTSGENIAAPKHTSTAYLDMNEGGKQKETELNRTSLRKSARSETISGEAKYNGKSSRNAEEQQHVGGGIERERERDSASESSDGGGGGGGGGGVRDRDRIDSRAQEYNRLAAGLYDTSSAGNSRIGSRTSSIGNGLNFYTHLEGRKSLFSADQFKRATMGLHGSGSYNNSTLSLTSLNRRKFNASIFGSTSALSDSRLLQRSTCSSPFYAEQTTYGGAGAYRKRNVSAASQIARLAPTLIRPSSSLSTHSGSNNSLATIGGGEGGGYSTNSNTTKHILDLMNEFATPLSEAKKMGNSLKLNQMSHGKGKRISDADLNATRSMQLSRVRRTPYERPAIRLLPQQPAGGAPPPVRELQVPMMAQLLQLKKTMQNTTERSRQIATRQQNNETATISTTTATAGNAISKKSVLQTQPTTKEYTLPSNVEPPAAKTDASVKEQQQTHTNKVRTKIAGSGRMRTTGTKNLENLAEEEAPPPVVLPTIQFPQMQSVPKIDIEIPSLPATTVASSSAKTTATTNFAFSMNKSNENANSKSVFGTTAMVEGAGNASSSQEMKTATVSGEQIATMRKFNFTVPIVIAAENKLLPNTLPVKKNFVFSVPNSGEDVKTTTTAPAVSVTTTAAPQLKTGSVLDALKLPVSSSSTTTNSSSNISSWLQIKKPTNEWECDTCMIRNKQEATKCAACETPHKITTTGNAIPPPSFGAQFKKPSDEWECDACMVRNKQSVEKCVACETPRKGANISTTPTSSFKFGEQFKKPANEWECDTCMIRNKQEATKCAACETPRKDTTTTKLPVISNTFGDAFKPKTDNTWACPTCLIRNDNTCNQCPCCETKKPGTATSDAGFQALAATQKASTWECTACMTRNIAIRTICICCEEPKPGSQSVSEDTPKFSFGTTAASKFKFGFAAAAAAGGDEASKKSEEQQVDEKKSSEATTTTTTQKTDTDNLKGFVFGNVVATTSTAAAAAATSTSGGFSFGFKPTAAATTAVTNSSGDTKVVAVPSGGFSFGANVSKTAGTGFSFGTTATTATTTAAAATTATSSTASTIAIATNTTAAAAAIADKPQPIPTISSGFAFKPTTNTTGGTTTAGFSFTNENKTEAKAVASSSATTSGGFTFKPTTAAPVEPAKAVTDSATIKSGNFTFGATTSQPATLNTAAATGGFSFGSPSSTAGATLAGAGAAATTSTDTSGGFTFGNNSASTAAKSLFTPSGTTTAAIIPALQAPPSATTPATSIFGNATSAATTASPAQQSSTATETPKIFGGFGAVSDMKPTESKSPMLGTASLFGNTSSVGGTTTATAAPFAAFGAPSTLAQVKPSNTAAPPSNQTSSSTNPAPPPAWGKTSSSSGSGGFTFGSSGATIRSSSVLDSGAGEFGAKKQAFEGFGAAASNANNNNGSTTATPSIFGNFSSTSSTAATPAFGSTSGGASTAAPNAFGSPNPFAASTASTGNAAAPSAPAFGAAPAPSVNAFGSPPAFGSAANTTTFAGFGGNSTTDGASAAKKSEPAFGFGATASGATSGGFNFATPAPAAKPAFNFSAAPVAQKTFSFTGAPTTADQQVTKPFQFGAAPAPMFNFTGGAAEADSNNASISDSTADAAKNSSAYTSYHATVEESTSSVSAQVELSTDKTPRTPNVGQITTENKNDDNNGTQQHSEKKEEKTAKRVTNLRVTRHVGEVGRRVQPHRTVKYRQIEVPVESGNKTTGYISPSKKKVQIVTQHKIRTVDVNADEGLKTTNIKPCVSLSSPYRKVNFKGTKTIQIVNVTTAATPTTNAATTTTTGTGSETIFEKANAKNDSAV